MAQPSGNSGPPPQYYYSRLGVPRTATEAEIGMAYTNARRRIQIAPGTQTTSDEQTVQYNSARLELDKIYDILTRERDEYDRQLARQDLAASQMTVAHGGGLPSTYGGPQPIQQVIVPRHGAFPIHAGLRSTQGGGTQPTQQAVVPSRGAVEHGGGTQPPMSGSPAGDGMLQPSVYRPPAARGMLSSNPNVAGGGSQMLQPTANRPRATYGRRRPFNWPDADAGDQAVVFRSNSIDDWNLPDYFGNRAPTNEEQTAGQRSGAVQDPTLSSEQQERQARVEAPLRNAPYPQQRQRSNSEENTGDDPYDMEKVRHNLPPR